ncbi:hypothetical protein HanRHA438_Chr02g0049841 [Helianthus annuus]|uniref:Uncharacterized protein n=1 Tax=Helianthus annuus TaxID=4232 RepID=A0A9K3JLF5_HELAN|nr:hypothetical protein HanXRQr2_Chr02g0048731 [Helianthus annuus]KAJ0613706.1 hypothetical protein HanIR_Chr02g0054401 [Helianthus annuus]KAJ0638779.1 hypothetical protein HanHA300_Chr00c0045g0697051 [Helianthus annuus]KAJ0776045.1 hypothetical protein HanLR1_Chr02g0041171 [Helianthus annuus]KAJ0938436.1 hypothetical protein HanRHA438_Chr02g0049841 [Helianthus annuus]
MAHMWHKWKSKFPFLIMIVNGCCSNRLAKMYMWHIWKSKLWFYILTPYGRFFIITSDKLPCFDMVNLTKWLMGLGNNKKIAGLKNSWKSKWLPGKNLFHWLTRRNLLKSFLHLAGTHLTGKDFTKAFDAACFPLTLILQRHLMQRLSS